jgi:hypothetical protein
MRCWAGGRRGGQGSGCLHYRGSLLAEVLYAAPFHLLVAVFLLLAASTALNPRGRWALNLSGRKIGGDAPHPKTMVDQSVSGRVIPRIIQAVFLLAGLTIVLTWAYIAGRWLFK